MLALKLHVSSPIVCVSLLLNFITTDHENIVIQFKFLVLALDSCVWITPIGKRTCSVGGTRDSFTLVAGTQCIFKVLMFVVPRRSSNNNVS